METYVFVSLDTCTHTYKDLLDEPSWTFERRVQVHFSQRVNIERLHQVDKSSWNLAKKR